MKIKNKRLRNLHRKKYTERVDVSDGTDKVFEHVRLKRVRNSDYIPFRAWLFRVFKMPGGWEMVK